MLITRKRFLEEIAKARKETEESIYQNQRLERMDRDIHERIERLEGRMWQLEENVGLHNVKVVNPKR